MRSYLDSIVVLEKNTICTTQNKLYFGDNQFYKILNQVLSC